MKRPLCSMLILASLTAAAGAQTVDQLQTQYNDALQQLKAAQDRKNELAAENEKLHKKLEETEKQLQDRSDELDTLQNRAYFLREHYAAWQQFIDQNASLRAMWFAYFASGNLKENVTDLLGDGKWPFGIPDSQ